ncbi:hypothetical protein D0T11_20170 [Hymenobacter rubripertinctus]|uniref:Uncharacterized protein n=2 Tax=Hymenobacter rubripertinctus TaxID=2029981 RepID=A0A418QKB8_9BACT|nr:hypothetical protein D0T11_20170 [Hymenobacter rubripertinctus]
MPPDIYLGIINKAYYHSPATLTFNPYIVVAGALDKGTEFDLAINQLVAVITQQTHAVFTHEKLLPWGIASDVRANA